MGFDVNKVRNIYINVFEESKKDEKKVNSYILRVGSGIKDRLESEIQVDSDSD